MNNSCFDLLGIIKDIWDKKISIECTNNSNKSDIFPKTQQTLISYVQPTFSWYIDTLDDEVIKTKFCWSKIITDFLSSLFTSFSPHLVFVRRKDQIGACHFCLYNWLKVSYKCTTHDYKSYFWYIKTLYKHLTPSTFFLNI